MINFNGTLTENSSTFISVENRGYKFGDALFETIKVLQGKILFWEDHYFRLMASMRILRMEIPMHFTMEFLQNEIIKTLDANDLINKSARVRLNVDRGEGGKYLPKTTSITFSIVVEPLNVDLYKFSDNSYTVDLFKDYYVSPDLLSTLKTNNKVINVVGSIYAMENQLDNCLLLNTNKNVVEALNGNLFLVTNNIIKTPPLSDGCLKGILRNQIIEKIKLMDDYDIEEASISPFELQRADELFITNVILGIQPISNYRKKEFSKNVSKLLLDKLNISLRLN
jgi:branched-chain amino acid aminotransferase